MNADRLDTLRHGLEATLRKAGALALERFQRRDFTTLSKGAQDFVSEVDRETETLLKQDLASLCPDAGFLGEEYGGKIEDLSWVIDPIDGTSNFVRGIPLWCLSVALVEKGRPVVGAIYDPNADEMFSAALNRGATLNGKPMAVSQAETADTAILGISFSFKSDPERHHAVLRRMMEKKGLYRFFGSGALALAYCAAGRTDGFWEDWMMPWDVAAGLILVSEAGGMVSDYCHGDGWEKGNAILASNRNLASMLSDVTGLSVSNHGLRS